MASLNKVMLIGNLGKDPEVRYLSKGQAVANFNIATSSVWKDAEGKKQEKTEWHRVVAFGKLAETCGEYLAKGKQVFVEGRLQTREWEDKNGQKRWTTEVVASTMLMLGRKGEGGGAPAAEGGEGGGEEVTYEPVSNNKGSDEDIPF